MWRLPLCYGVHHEPNLAAAGLLAATLSTAAVADDDLWLAARAGSHGLGVEATWRPVPNLDLRAGYSRYDYDTTRTKLGIDYDAELGLESLYATVNARVPASPLRFSAGVVANGNEGNLLANDTGFYDIGGQIFDAADVGNLRGRATFDDLAPYAGIGLDFRLLDRMGLHFDAGVMYQGEPAVAMSADGILAGDPNFQAALEVERRVVLRQLLTVRAPLLC